MNHLKDVKLIKKLRIKEKETRRRKEEEEEEMKGGWKKE